MLAATAVLIALSGTGVGIQGNPVCVSAARPGGTYHPGSVYAQDTGGDPETIVMGSFPPGWHQDLFKGQKPLSASWLSFGYPPSWFGLVHNSSLGLKPGASGLVAVTVTIPAGASRGDYVTNLWAHTAASTAQMSGGTVAVAGAGAATFLIVAVGQRVSCDLPLPAVPHQSTAQLNAAAQAMETASATAARAATMRKGLAVAAVVFIAGLLISAQGSRRQTGVRRR